MPDFDFRTTRNFDVIAFRLWRFCRIGRDLASKRLHSIKSIHGLPGDQDVVFDLSGGVYILISGELEFLGSLTAGGSKERT